MRSPVLLGALIALAVGTLALAGLVAAVGGQPPLSLASAAPRPGSSPLGLYTPSPGPTEAVTPSIAPTAGIGTQVGQRAPRLLLPSLGGGELDSAAFAGRPLWVTFMASWCPSCREELPLMERIDTQLGDSLDVVLVDVMEDEATVRGFLDALGVELPTALDVDGSTQAAWGAYVLPVHFFIDGDGIVREYVFGGAPEEILMGAILTVVPEAQLEPGEDAEGDPGVEP